MLINAISPIRRLKGEEGQDLVEFALALPILATLLFGIIDFGWMFYNNVMVSNAAREGARFAVMNYEEAETNDPSDPLGYLQGQVTTNVENDLPGYLHDSFANLAVTLNENHIGADNDELVLEIQSNIRLFTPVGRLVMGGGQTRIVRNASMKKMN